MRDYAQEFESRVAFIRGLVEASGASGIIYGNSGGKDSALVGLLCKAACENTLGVMMPCASKRNFGSDMADGIAAAEAAKIETRTVDLTAVREAAVEAIGGAARLSAAATGNINPRLRMITLYAIAQSENRLVAGTGNRSEIHMGYFTKWGDGGCDFNPISDLTVTEVYEFLEYLDAPLSIRTKAPSAGLFEGQTDEEDMGVSYAAIDRYLAGGEVTEAEREIIERYHSRSGHKRTGVAYYAGKIEI